MKLEEQVKELKEAAEESENAKKLQIEQEESKSKEEE